MLAWLLRLLAGLCADTSWWFARALFVAAARWRMPRAGYRRSSRAPDRMALIAHRGASVTLPENTLAAALAALDAGAAGTEYDLQQLACGTLVVLHDGTLRRTAHPGTHPNLLDVPIGQLRLQDVAHVDIGGEILPTFARMLSTLLARHPVRISFAELKVGAGPTMVAEALRVVLEVGANPEQIIFICFDSNVCAQLKAGAPGYRVFLLGFCASEAGVRKTMEEALRLGIDGINVNAHPTAVTAAVVQEVHLHGLAMAVWVYRAPAPNDCESVWDYMERVSVDYCTTNLPPEVHCWAARAQATDPPNEI